MATFSFGAGQSNYTGEVLNDLLSYTAEENETYRHGLIHVETGIQKKLALPLVQSGKIIQDRIPTPAQATGAGLSANSVGSYRFTERYLEPQDFMIYMEFNPRDFESYYRQFQPDGTLVFRKLDPRVQATMLRLLMEGKESYINNAIWRSATGTQKVKIKTATSTSQDIIGGDVQEGPLKYFGGAIYRMLYNHARKPSDTGVDLEEYNGGQITLTGNTDFADGKAVSDELYKAWQACPPHIRYNKDLCFLMDYTSWDKYDLYCTTQLYKYTDNRDENQRMFRGKRILPMTALPENTIILGVFNNTRASNLWMGLDYADAENVIQVDKLQANSELYFFKALLKMDVNIVRPKEIVAHLPFTYSAD